ncbi:MAG: hypothetical protein D3910_08585 [Candidatus Electrothrix sp. ATG2]|nr:hypothetical protein [Candidatus Electrothrix sp. ATG2]
MGTLRPTFMVFFLPKLQAEVERHRVSAQSAAISRTVLFIVCSPFLSAGQRRRIGSVDFGKDYGVRIADSALAGLFARAVVVIDKEGKVIYAQLVPEIAEEPDYEAALAALA